MRGGRSVLKEKLNVIYVLLKYLFVTVLGKCSFDTIRLNEIKQLLQTYFTNLTEQFL